MGTKPLFAAGIGILLVTAGCLTTYEPGAHSPPGVAKTYFADTSVPGNDRVYLKEPDNPDAARRWLAYLRTQDGGAIFKSGDPDDFVIVDPGRLAALGFADFDVYSGRLQRVEVDLDGDGIDDLVLKNTGQAGNRLTAAAAFRAVPGGYSLVGLPSLGSEGSWRPLPPTPEGGVRLVVYAGLNAASGNFRWLVEEGNALVLENTEFVEPGDGGTEVGRKRYREVLHPE